MPSAMTDETQVIENGNAEAEIDMILTEVLAEGSSYLQWCNIGV